MEVMLLLYLYVSEREDEMYERDGEKKMILLIG